MSSVTRHINVVKQPYGGYLPVRNWYKTEYTDDYSLFDQENIHSSLVGLAVDYLSRYMLGEAAENAFNISLLGADIIGETKSAHALLNTINGLDSNSIICACKLSGYDVCFRAGIRGYKPVEDIEPDEATIHNIRVMVIRCMNLFEIIGPITKACISFEGGYTSTVDAGDGDYMTEDAIWDLKVSKNNPTSKHTLQLLMYYIMGLHSIYPEFHNVKHLGIFNPRLNLSYTFDVADIAPDVIQSVESDVICYGINDEQKDVPVVYTVSEVSEHLGIKRTIILRMIREQVIRAEKVKNRYVIDEDALLQLEEYLRRQRILYAVKIGLLTVFAWIIVMITLSSIAR